MKEIEQSGLIKNVKWEGIYLRKEMKEEILGRWLQIWDQNVEK